MFDWLDRQLKLLAIKRSLLRRAPERFTYNETNNFFTSWLENRRTAETFVVLSADDNVISGTIRNSEGTRTDFSIGTAELAEWKLRTHRHFGYVHIIYGNAFEYWWGELSLKPLRALAKETLTQSVYNARTRFRSDRIQLLRKLIDIHLSEAANTEAILGTTQTKSANQLLSEVYGDRIFGHPDFDHFSARFRLLLDSLVASEDLVSAESHKFELAPRALVTLSAYEQDERRHADSIKQNRRLFWITVAIALATAMQAYSAFFKQ